MKDKTLIFDLDGTLVDARELHRASFEWALQQQDPTFKMTPELTHELEGIPTINKVVLLNSQGYNFNIEKAFEDKQTHTNLHLHMLSWHPGLPKLLDKLADKYNIAIASNARSQFVYKVVALMNITNIDIILTANFVDIHQRKPDPHIFDKAIKLMGANPMHTTIFEDSDAGIKAARASQAHNIIRVNNSSDTYMYLEKLI